MLSKRRKGDCSPRRTKLLTSVRVAFTLSSSAAMRFSEECSGRCLARSKSSSEKVRESADREVKMEEDLLY